MRRWVRYEAPIMVCVELGEDGHTGKVINVVLATDHEDIGLARDYRGQYLVYDDTMNPLQNDGHETDTAAITLAEHREWPNPHDWEQGPDALRYPGLYDIDDDPDNVDHDENAGNLDNVGRQPR
jgi:hypothetical protein